MGTVPMGTGLLRMIHSRVVWMSGPVERSMTVSAPHRVDHVSLSTSSAIDDVTAELPMLALTVTGLDVTPARDPPVAQGREPLVRVTARPTGVVEPDARLLAAEDHLGERHL